MFYNDVIHTIQGTIGQYFATIHCVVCGRLSVKNVCSLCTGDPQKVATVITNQIQSSETSYHQLLLVSICVFICVTLCVYICLCMHAAMYVCVHAWCACVCVYISCVIFSFKLCSHCVASRDVHHIIGCVSLDCPVLSRRLCAKHKLQTSAEMRSLLDKLP